MLATAPPSANRTEMVLLRMRNGVSMNLHDKYATPIEIAIRPSFAVKVACSNRMPSERWNTMIGQCQR